MKEEQRSLLLDSLTSHSPPGAKVCYGEGGFMVDASLLESVAYRAGILAALRSLKSQSVIGLMITDSGEVPGSSQVRIIDPDGGVLTSRWELFADSLANAADPVECVSLIEKFVMEENISFEGNQPAEILLGRNTRTGGESLLHATKLGINSIIGSVSHDMGIVTASQLHELVDATYNGLKASEQEYLEQLSGSDRCLPDLTPNKTTAVSVGENLVNDDEVAVDRVDALGKVQNVVNPSSPIQEGTDSQTGIDNGIHVYLTEHPEQRVDDSKVDASDLDLKDKSFEIEAGEAISKFSDETQKQRSPDSSVSSAKIEDRGDVETTNVQSDQRAEEAVMEENQDNLVKTYNDETETQSVSCGKEVVEEKEIQSDTQPPKDREAEVRNMNNPCLVQEFTEQKPDCVTNEEAPLRHNDTIPRIAADNVLVQLTAEAVGQPAVDEKGHRLVACQVGADMKGSEVIFRPELSHELVEPTRDDEDSCLSSEAVEKRAVTDGDGPTAGSVPQSLAKGSKVLNSSYGDNVQLENAAADSETDLVLTVYLDQTETGDVNSAGSTSDIKPESIAIAEDSLSSSPVNDVDLKTDAVNLKDVPIPADNDQSEETGLLIEGGSTCDMKSQSTENGKYILNSSDSADAKSKNEAAHGDMDVDNGPSCMVDGKISDTNISFSSSVNGEKELVNNSENVPTPSGSDSRLTGAVNVELELQPQVSGMSSLYSPLLHEDMIENDPESSPVDNREQSKCKSSDVSMETKSSLLTYELNEVNGPLSNGGEAHILSEVDEVGVDNGGADTSSQPETDEVLPSHVHIRNSEIKYENGPLHIGNQSTSIIDNVEGDVADSSMVENGETESPSVVNRIPTEISNSLHNSESEIEAKTDSSEADESGSSCFTDDKYPQSQSNSMDAYGCTDHDLKLDSSGCVTVHGDCRSNGLVSDFSLNPKISFGSFKSELFSESSGSQVINGISRGPCSQGDAGDNLFESKAGEALSIGTDFAQCKADSFACAERRHGNNHGQVNGELVCVIGANADEVSIASHEESTTDTQDEESVDYEMVKMPFYYMIKIPRYDDPKHSDQKKLAQDEVDEKTRRRTAVQAEYRKVKESCLELKQNLESAIREERGARDQVRAKRKEVDSFQALVNIAKDAMTIDDLDRKIADMEHNIEHETMSLTEEKKLMHEVKMLKKRHQQLLAAATEKQGVEQALEGKEKNQESVKVLRKEMDAVKGRLSQLEQATKAAKRKYDDETLKLKAFYDKCQAANAVREQAYIHLRDLKKQWSDKVKPFYQWKEDQTKAYQFAANGDKESLQHHCLNQVETTMRLWNTSDEFRREYIRCNKSRTARNFGTLDGRALGINEEPASIGLISGHDLNTSAAEAQVPKKATVEPSVVPEVKDTNVQSLTKDAGQKIPKKAGKASQKKIDIAEASSIKQKQEKDNEALKLKQEEDELARKAQEIKKEEEELARKAEEIRKEKEAAKLKELRRQEEKAKAQEALERKRRNAEKAQVKAEMKAKKEAEQKEKERERRARKKEKKKATNAETPIPETEASTSIEVSNDPSKEPEIREQQVSTTVKRSLRSQYTKQNKIKSIAPPPPCLRNRGKRRMQQWIWVLAIVVAVVCIFFLGNSNFSNVRELFDY